MNSSVLGKMVSVVPGLVSVIIPTYNRSVLCKLAVESVLSQSYKNVEVIVVDDGSNDGTRQIISVFDSRVQYVWQKNAGVAAARNLGMDIAKGEFIAFLDSDDTWLPWKLETQLAVLKEFPSVGMVFTDMIAVGENGVELYASYKNRMFGIYESFNPELHFRLNKTIGEVWNNCPDVFSKRKCYVGNIFRWMFIGNLILTSTVLIRRQRQAEVGLFDVTLLKSGEDYDFHFRTCRLGDVAYLDLSSMRYRIGATDQLTSSDLVIWIAKNDLKTITKMVSVAREEIPFRDSVIRKRIARSYAWIGMEEFSRNGENAKEYLWESLKLSPFQARVAAHYLLSYFPASFIDKLRTIKRKLNGFTARLTLERQAGQSQEKIDR